MSATLPALQHIDRDRVAALMERERTRLLRAHREVRRVLQARFSRHARRCSVAVPEERPVAHVPRTRLGREGLGRRRQRVHRLPQRLRRDVRRPRQPDHRRRREGAHGRGHALRRADRGLDHRRRGAPAPLGPPALALHQLRHRVHDGRDPPRARLHRPRHHRQDRGHLPRPSRRRDGLGQAAPGRDGPARAARTRSPTASASRPAPPSTPASSRSTTPRRSPPRSTTAWPA